MTVVARQLRAIVVKVSGVGGAIGGGVGSDCKRLAVVSKLFHFCLKFNTNCDSNTVGIEREKSNEQIICG